MIFNKNILLSPLKCIWSVTEHKIQFLCSALISKALICGNHDVYLHHFALNRTHHTFVSLFRSISSMRSVPVCIPQPSVGLLLVLDVVEALSGRQVLLVVLDRLLVVSQGVVAVRQVPVSSASVQQALGAAQLLQHGQLLLEITDGFLKHPHVKFGDAHVPVDLSLQAGIPQALRQAELSLVTLESR